MKSLKRFMYCFIAFMCIVSCAFIFGTVSARAYEGTGHSEFRSIKFVEEGHNLLVDYDKNEIERAYGKVNRKFMGWSTYYFNVDEKVYYDGKVIFSRSNKTANSIDFEYTLKETEVTKTAVTINGSVSAKVSGSVKLVSLGADLKGGVETEDSVSYTSDAKTTINVKVLPRTKVTFIETGEGYLTSGVSKYYFFGMRLRQGDWERIDVDTLYFELREELL